MLHEQPLGALDFLRVGPGRQRLGLLHIVGQCLGGLLSEHGAGCMPVREAGVVRPLAKQPVDLGDAPPLRRIVSRPALCRPVAQNPGDGTVAQGVGVPPHVLQRQVRGRGRRRHGRHVSVCNASVYRKRLKSVCRQYFGPGLPAAGGQVLLLVDFEKTEQR